MRARDVVSIGVFGAFLFVSFVNANAENGIKLKCSKRTVQEIKDVCTTKIEELNGQLTSCGEKNKALEEKCNMAMANATLAQTQAANAATMANGAKNICDEMKKACEDALAQCSSDFDACQTQVQTCEGEKAFLSSQITQLESEKSALQAQYDTCSAELTTCSSEKTSLQSQLDTALQPDPVKILTIAERGASRCARRLAFGATVGVLTGKPWGTKRAGTKRFNKIIQRLLLKCLRNEAQRLQKIKESLVSNNIILNVSDK